MSACVRNINARVHLPSVWAFRPGGGEMEDKLRALVSPSRATIAGAFFI